MKKQCDSKTKCIAEKLETGSELLWFGLKTLLESIMITSTVILVTLYFIFDGNLTNMLTDLLNMGDEKIKDTFKVIFVPILFILFAFRSFEFMSFRKLRSEYQGEMVKQKAETTSAEVVTGFVNMQEKLKEVDVRRHKIITGETGTGKTSRIRNLIDILELNNESTLVIDIKPLNIWTDMEKEVKFKTANFSDDISLDNYTTVIIDEALNLNEHPTLKDAVLENFRNDKNVFILSFQKENDSVDFFKKN